MEMYKVRDQNGCVKHRASLRAVESSGFGSFVSVTISPLQWRSKVCLELLNGMNGFSWKERVNSWGEMLHSLSCGSRTLFLLADVEPAAGFCLCCSKPFCCEFQSSTHQAASLSSLACVPCHTLGAELGDLCYRMSQQGNGISPSRDASRGSPGS